MIEIRSEFVRIARQFTGGTTGVNDSYLRVRSDLAVQHVYVEPAPAGGVYVVGTDASVLCVHYEREGKVDRPYVIKGLTREHDFILSNGASSYDRWLIATPQGVIVKTADGKQIPLEGVTINPADRISNNPPHGVIAFPDWRAVVPTREEIAKMKMGYPYTLNVAYLSILARLYDTGSIASRAVQIRSFGTMEKPVVLTFPWRPDLTVVIQSVTVSATTHMPDPAAVLHDGFDVPEATPDVPDTSAPSDDQDVPDVPEGGWGDEDWDDEEEDEAAGL